MAIGTGAAILGSSILGMGASALGARGVNRAAEDNTALATRNIEAANRAAYQGLPQAHEDRLTGAGFMAGGLAGGAERYLDNTALQRGQAPYGLNAMRTIDPNFAGEPNFTRDPNIAGTWGHLSGPGAVENFYESPDYQFRLKEGLDAVQNSAAARGGLYSGNTLRGITDYASDLASQEYGKWFGREQGLADRDYGAATSDYGRAADQFAGNYGRAADQFGQNYGRDYNRWADLANIGNQATMAGAGVQYGSDVGVGQTFADTYGAKAQDIIGAGQTVAGNYAGNAQIQSQTPYVSPWGGVNNAAQGGIQNYMWAQNAGMTGQPTQYDFQGRPISNKPQLTGPQVGWVPPPKLYPGLQGGGIG